MYLKPYIQSWITLGRILCSTASGLISNFFPSCPRSFLLSDLIKLGKSYVPLPLPFAFIFSQIEKDTPQLQLLIAHKRASIYPVVLWLEGLLWFSFAYKASAPKIKVFIRIKLCSEWSIVVSKILRCFSISFGPFFNNGNQNPLYIELGKTDDDYYRECLGNQASFTIGIYRGGEDVTRKREVQWETTYCLYMLFPIVLLAISLFGICMLCAGGVLLPCKYQL